MSKSIDCPEHGKNEACMICSHLIQESDLQFARVLVNPTDEDMETAMCLDCETFLLDDGEWSEELADFAQWKIYCRECYQRELNKHQLAAEGYMK